MGRPETSRCLWVLLAALATPRAVAVVVDRIAVVVGKTVITESEVIQEARLTEFLNQAPLELGPEARRAAAERLVDQQLIRNEMEIGGYPSPPAAEADAMLRRFREEHYGTDAEFQAALAKYGITEEQLKQHFLWQLAVMRFTDLRFGMGLAAATATEGNANRTGLPGTAATDGSAAGEVPGSTAGAGAANRVAPGGEAPTGGDVDQQMEAWLKQARAQTRIRFKKEAFQ